MTEVKRSPAGRPKSQEKQQNILASASCLFLRNGFTSTSMDNVAKDAGVSKQTVYSHYKNKDALFSAVIDWKVEQYQLDDEHIKQQGDDLNSVLTTIGLQFVQLLHDPEVIAMYRVMMGEVSSDIHIAELFYESGPKRAIFLLVNYLLQRPKQSLNQKQAIDLSLVFFNLLKGEHHMKSLLGLPHQLSAEEQVKFVESVVRRFTVILEHEET